MTNSTDRERNSPVPSRKTRLTSTVRRIAIADDNPEDLELVAQILGGPSTDIVKATGSEELMEIIARSGPFDLIVTDIDMPWMEGLTVIGFARAEGVQTPVLVVTGLSRGDIEHTVARIGNCKLVRKPLDAEILRHTAMDLMEGAS